MLRQVYVQRILQGTLDPGARLGKIAPEVQRLMFPGATFDQIQKLTREMEFLMTRRGMAKSTAGGMSAMAKVEHPIGGRMLGPVITKVPLLGAGANALARSVHGKIYATVTELITRPAVLRWIEKGLTKGTPEEKEALREILWKRMQNAGGLGAGIGEAVEQQ